jgi:uncharacterized protein (DUF2126 family)
VIAPAPPAAGDGGDGGAPGGGGGGDAQGDGGELAAALAAHDELIARRRVEIWIGAEPTFTRADSTAPAWTGAAVGDDKLARAHALATHLADALPGAVTSRVVGRQFPEEPEPRFAFGVRWPRGGAGAAAAPAGGAAAAARVAIDAPPEPPPTAVGADHWLTVTPDPGVVEVNTAPCATAQELYAQARAIWAAAAAAGLAPGRHRYNGDPADSGGGGQLTLGGPSPTASPFVRYPHVLPALVRYANNHPSLSYWFAGECVGSASQGPRPDEGARERWDELAVALAWVERLADRGELAPDRLHAALAPLLVDSAGNTHRAELNLEKLWSAHLPAHGTRHGRMGLVELRAIRMPERPELLAALAALARGVVARLVVADYRAPLVDWHDELHDRLALPAALARDLRLVLGDLDEHGLGLPGPLRRELERWRDPGITCRLGEATLAIRPALEFWPLVGDVASQERAPARLVDASTARLELSCDGAGPDRVVVAGRWAQLRPLGDGVRAVGIRRRIYEPAPGLHPGLPPRDPLVIEWAHAGRAQRVELWAWRPDGGPYPGLPRDAADALARRSARVRIAPLPAEPTAAGHWPEVRPFTIDLRLDP